MPDLIHPRTTRRALLAAGATLLLLASMPLAVGAAPSGPFVTTRPSMLALGTEAPVGATFQPIITVGDQVGPKYKYLSVPDGIGYMGAGNHGATVYINHETSTSPFPYGSLMTSTAAAVPPNTSNSFNDFDNSQVSKLLLKQKGGVVGVNNGHVVIPSSANFQRFCSNFLALTDGFETRPMLFTNEETPDWYNTTGTAWTNASSLEGAPGAREGGVTVAYDVNAGVYKTILGMGRFNHENTVAIPGYGHPFLLSGDDTFTSNPAQSQVYAYNAASADAIWNDAGQLMAFVPDDAYAAVNDYYDFPISTSMSISGHFIPVPPEIATGKLASGAEITSATVPASIYGAGGAYPPPPNGGSSWQARPFDWNADPTGNPANQVGIDGPQWVLEVWSDRHNVFQFTRIEDMAYDKTNPNVVYLADSGRGATSAGGNAFTSSNGRIWRMELGAEPTTVTSLSILIEGDDHPVKTNGEIHQPDNLEATVNALYILEDPGSSQQFNLDQQGTDPGATTARIWQYKFGDPTPKQIFKVDQSSDETVGYDVDQASAAGRWGEWETTGLVDVSASFGPGTFLVNVQAHTLYTEIDTTSAPDTFAPHPTPDWTWKREGGQLLLVTIPGG